MSSSDDDTRERPASDKPLDLIKERDAFVRSFLKKGVEYTEQLLRENHQLRRELEQLQLVHLLPRILLQLLP